MESKEKKIFRIDENNINESFQTANIKEKLKNIKKRKKKKVNFKNVEEFEILENTNNYDDKEEDEKLEQKDKKTITTSSLVYSFYDSINRFLFPSPLKEGVRFKRDDYEGYDNVKEGARSNFDPRRLISEAIERFYDRINQLNTIIATFVLDSMSEGRHNQNDIAVTRENLVLILSTAAASYAVFNWYFILFYAPAEGIPIARFSRIMLLKMGDDDGDESTSDSGPSMYKFLFWSCEFAVAFFEYFNDLFILFLPKIFTFFFDGRMNFITIFIALIYILKNFAIAYKNFLIGLLYNTTENSLINAMYGILMVLYVLSTGSLQFTGNITGDIDRALKFIGEFMSPLVMIVKIIIRFMVIMIISVPLGGLAIGAIVFYYSFFGIFHYMGTNRFMTTINGIINHVKYKNSLYGKTKYCRTDPFYRFLLLVISIIKLLCQSIYLLRTPLAFLVMFIFASISSFDNLSSVRTLIADQDLNIVMGVIFAIMAICAGLLVGANIFLTKEFLELIDALKKDIPNVYKEPSEEEKDLNAYKLPDIYEEYFMKQTKANTVYESLKEIIKIESDEKKKAMGKGKGGTENKESETKE